MTTTPLDPAGRASALRWLVLLGLTLWGVACASGPPPTLVEQGDAAFAEGAYRAADALYQQALEAQPRSLEALHGRARVAVVLRRPEDALRAYGQIGRIDRAYLTGRAAPDHARALYEAATSRLDTGEAGKALQAMRVLSKVDAGYPGTPVLLARVLTAYGEWLVMHGRRDEAMRHYKEAMATDPGLAAAYVGAAEILLTAGDRGAALALLTDAQRKSPGDRRIRALTVQAMGLY